MDNYINVKHCLRVLVRRNNDSRPTRLGAHDVAIVLVAEHSSIVVVGLNAVTDAGVGGILGHHLEACGQNLRQALAHIDMHLL